MGVVFLSAVTSELREWRALLHRAFSEAGCEVIVQDFSLGAFAGDVLDTLTRGLDRADLVVHLAGQACGAIPERVAIPGFACSYTQLEFYRPASRDRPVVALVLGAGFPTTPVDEDEPRRALQAEHRRRLIEGDYAGTPLKKRWLAKQVPSVNDLLVQVAAVVREVAGLERAAELLRSLQALHQLPAPPAGFVGRTKELAKLRAADARGGVLLSGLKGMGGIGKTALAQVLANEWATRFPDAQLWIDGQGTSANVPSAGALLERAIRAFHPEARLPEELPALQAIYRQCLDGRRALVVIDNARDAAQVIPLLPPTGCAMLVTSRRAFVIGNMVPTAVGRLDRAEAVELLRAQLATLPDGDADALDTLCAGLPLALRVAGAHLAIDAAEPGGRADVAGYLRRLRSGRLATLDAHAEDAGEVTVSETLRLSEEQLAPGGRDGWRKLGVFAGSFGLDAALAVAAVDEALADRLVRRSLLERDGDRVRMHDLAAEYALQQVADEVATRLAHAEWFRAVLAECKGEYNDGRPVEGLARFDRERGEIEAAHSWLVAATVPGRDELLVGLLDAGVYVLNLRLHGREQIRWLEAAVAAARRTGDRGSEGDALGNLGLAWAELGETRKAIDYYERQLVIARELGDRRGGGNALGSLGLAWAELGETRKAIDYYEQTLVIAREVGDRRGEGNALGNLGTAWRRLAEPRKAIDYFEQRLVIARELGDRRGEGNGLGNLGNAWADLGETRKAIDYYDQQLLIARGIGDRRGEGNALGNVGTAWADLGETRTAIDHYEQHLVIAREIGDRRGAANTHFNSALAWESLGDRAAALHHAEGAARLYTEIESPHAADALALVARLRAAPT